MPPTRTDRALRLAWWWLGALLFLAIGRDFMANGRPLYCRIDGQAYFPGIRSVFFDPNKNFGVPVLDSLRSDPIRWKTYPYESAVFAPVPFSPGEWFLQSQCALARPGALHPGFSPRFRHWLGTDSQGRDVAAGMVSGARIALLTGALAMLMAFGIGILLGGIAGFFGDDRLLVSKSLLWCGIAGTLSALFYTAAIADAVPAVRRIFILPAVGIGIVGIALLLGKGLERAGVGAKTAIVPADLGIMRFAELFNAIPILILIIAVAAITENQSTWVMIALIGAFSWPGAAIFIRAELLRIRSLDYIEAARGLGYSNMRILWRHALPNAMQPALVAFALGVGSAVVVEASLSFLGYGGTEFQGISWGSLLQNVVKHRNAWWLVFPPGLAIGLTVFALNILADKRRLQQ